MALGTTVTFTAQLTGVALTPVTPAGKVTFTINGVATTDCGVVGVVQVNSAGAATCTTSTLVAPADVIVATYSGDTNFTVAAPTTITEIVGKVAAQTALTSAPASPAVNQQVTFTATVKPPSGTVEPTGSVTFSQGATTLCAAVTLTVNSSNSTATCPYAFTAVTAGTTITATYSGDANFSSGTPGTINEVVTTTGTTTSLSSTPPSSTVNQPVAFTATVTPTFSGAAKPTGTVKFVDNTTSTTLCSSVPLSNGTAVCNNPFLSTGSNSVVATYTSGDTNFTGSASSADVQVVGKTATTTTVVGSPSPSAVNQMVTFTATITPAITGSTTPTGTVAFSYVVNGGAPVTLCASANATTAAGVTTATCTDPLPANGNYTITAAYNGDANFVQSSGTVLQPVGLTQTTTTLSATSSTSAVNQSVTFTATVTPTTTGSTNPSGTVTFSYTSATVTTPVNLCAPQTVSTTAGKTTATCSAALPGAASDTVKATYSGDTNFGSSSVTATQTVNKTATTTTVVASPSATSVNQSVTFTATITPTFTGSTNPAGTVAFSYVLNGGAPVTLCASANVTTAAGVTTAVCAAPLLTAGSYVVTAAYNGDANFVQSSGTVVQPVGLTQTTTTVVGTPSPSSVNQSVTFTATITPAIALFAGSTNPGGTVAFSYSLNGGAPVSLCASAAVNTVGTITTATCPATLPSQGAYVITAAYSGDSNFKAGSGTTPQTVVGTATTTTVVSAPSPSSVNQLVAFTATIKPAVTGTTNPGGTVAFTYVLNGGTAVTLCASAGVNTVAGVTTSKCTDPLPATGSYVVTATYSGDTNFGSSFNNVTQTVNQTNLTLAVTPSLASPFVNQPLSFTATITLAVPGSTEPTGTVAFIDTSTVPVTPLCTKTISSGAVDSCASVFSTAGTHSIVATYSGDSNYSAATSPVLPLPVAQAPTTLALTQLPPIVATAPVAFTATVTTNFTGTAKFTGAVSFSSSDGTLQATASCQAVPIAATTGTAVCNAQFPATIALGQSLQTISATYSSDNNFATSTGSITQTVQNFSIANAVTSTLSPTATTGPVTLTQGYSTATSSATGTDPFNPTAVALVVTSSGAFGDTLNLTCHVTNSAQAVVSDPSCTISPTESGVTGTSLTYTLSASANAPIGIYTVTLTAADSLHTALAKVTALTVYVVGVDGTLSLAQGASGQENASFNTSSAPSPDALTAIACGEVVPIVNGVAGKPLSNPGLTCTGQIPTGAPSTCRTPDRLVDPFAVLHGDLGRRRAGKCVRGFPSLTRARRPPPHTVSARLLPPSPRSAALALIRSSEM